MKSKNNSFDSLFYFESKEEKYRYDADILMFKFLDEVEKLMNKEKITKKELASKINTSPSFITQLFRGTKLINLVTLAKIQDALELEFNINCKEPQKDQVSKNEIEEYLKNNKGNYFIYFKNTKKDANDKGLYSSTLSSSKRKIA